MLWLKQNSALTQNFYFAVLWNHKHLPLIWGYISIWRVLSSGIYGRVARWKPTDVSASTLMMEAMFLRNVSPLWEPEILCIHTSLRLWPCLAFYIFMNCDIESPQDIFSNNNNTNNIKISWNIRCNVNKWNCCCRDNKLPVSKMSGSWYRIKLPNVHSTLTNSETKLLTRGR
jgi:hypothetical protein